MITLFLLFIELYLHYRNILVEMCLSRIISHTMSSDNLAPGERAEASGTRGCGGVRRLMGLVREAPPASRATHSVSEAQSLQKQDFGVSGPNWQPPRDTPPQSASNSKGPGQQSPL